MGQSGYTIVIYTTAVAASPVSGDRAVAQGEGAVVFVIYAAAVARDIARDRAVGDGEPAAGQKYATATVRCSVRSPVSPTARIRKFGAD